MSAKIATRTVPQLNVVSKHAKQLCMEFPVIDLRIGRLTYTDCVENSLTLSNFFHVFVGYTKWTFVFFLAQKSQFFKLISPQSLHRSRYDYGNRVAPLKPDSHSDNCNSKRAVSFEIVN